MLAGRFHESTSGVLAWKGTTCTCTRSRDIVTLNIWSVRSGSRGGLVLEPRLRQGWLETLKVHISPPFCIIDRLLYTYFSSPRQVPRTRWAPIIQPSRWQAFVSASSTSFRTCSCTDDVHVLPVAVGGTMGYVKGGSKPSLIAGLGLGASYGVAGMSRSCDADFWLFNASSY